jgi:hypothetical protein
MIKRVLLILAGVLITAFIVMQFFPPARNSSPMSGDDFLSPQQDIPAGIKAIVKESCSDCHSNHTHYPWYNHVAPVSWFLSRHIRHGKEELNFSDWGTLSVRKRISTLQDICEVVTEGSMPLKSYTLIHRHARIDEVSKTRLCDWTKEESMRLLGE